MDFLIAHSSAISLRGKQQLAIEFDIKGRAIVIKFDEQYIYTEILLDRGHEPRSQLVVTSKDLCVTNDDVHNENHGPIERKCKPSVMPCHTVDSTLYMKLNAKICNALSWTGIGMCAFDQPS